MTRKTIEARIAQQCEYLMEKHNAEFASCYGEPGYTDPARGIIFADWNKIPRGLGDWLESKGFELEWADEWEVIDNKAWRTSPDCYAWQPSIALTDDGEWLTPDDDAAAWLDEFSITDPAQPMRHLPSWVDPASEGYMLFRDNCESGWHAGQTDNPASVAREAFAIGAERVAILKTEQSQFYSRWQCWALMPEGTEFECHSVVGGWQTAVKGTEYRFGPVFNASTELWAWQADNLPKRN